MDTNAKAKAIIKHFEEITDINLVIEILKRSESTAKQALMIEQEFGVTGVQAVIEG